MTLVAEYLLFIITFKLILLPAVQRNMQINTPVNHSAHGTGYFTVVYVSIITFNKCCSFMAITCSVNRTCW